MAARKRANSEHGEGLAHWGGAMPTFLNSGTVEKTAGSGRTSIGFRFDNRGAVRAESGELSFSGGATAPSSDGSWTGSGSGAIRFGGGTFEVGRWQLAGSVKLDGSTVTATGLTAPAADVTLASGVLSVTDAAVSSQLRGLAISGGTLGGAGTLNVSDSFSWSSGQMNGTGQTVLGAGVVGSLAAGGGYVVFSQRTLVNRGTLTWSSGSIRGSNASSVVNAEIFQAVDEGLDVWRPVRAEKLRGDIYRIVDEAYDREVDTWQFEPGDVVVCEEIDSSDGRILAAVAPSTS